MSEREIREVYRRQVYAVYAADYLCIAGDHDLVRLNADDRVLLRSARAVDALHIQRNFLHHAYRYRDRHRRHVELESLGLHGVAVLVYEDNGDLRRPRHRKVVAAHFRIDMVDLFKHGLGSGDLYRLGLKLDLARDVVLRGASDKLGLHRHGLRGHLRHVEADGLGVAAHEADRVLIDVVRVSEGIVLRQRAGGAYERDVYYRLHVRSR